MIGGRLRHDIEDMPAKGALVTFILIGEDGEISQTHGVTDKRAMVAGMRPGDRLLAVWTGQWHSDAFDLTDQLADVASRIL